MLKIGNAMIIPTMMKVAGFNNPFRTDFRWFEEFMDSFISPPPIRQDNEISAIRAGKISCEEIPFPTNVLYMIRLSIVFCRFRPGPFWGPKLGVLS